MSLRYVDTRPTAPLTPAQIQTAQACATRWAWAIPSCWGGMAASAYEKIEYGRITRPEDVQPPVPSAPQTLDEMTVYGDWTPDQAREDSIAAYGRRLRERIAQDEADGSYNPDGNLPADASQVSDFWEKYANWIIAGGALVGGAIVLGAVRR